METKNDGFSVGALREKARLARISIDEQIAQNSQRYINERTEAGIEYIKTCLDALASRGGYEGNFPVPLDTNFPPGYAQPMNRIRNQKDLDAIITSKIAAYFRERGLKAFGVGTMRLNVSFAEQHPECETFDSD